jgi:hypothetical protein
MTTDNFCFYLQNRQIQTSQKGGQQYSYTSPFSIPWLGHLAWGGGLDFYFPKEYFTPKYQQLRAKMTWTTCTLKKCKKLKKKFVMQL